MSTRDEQRDVERWDGRPVSLPDDVRARPESFVDGRDSDGVLQLIMRLLHGALDAHLAGQATRIELESHADHFRICDDGPGIGARELLSAATRARTGRRAGRELGLGLVNSLAARVEVETCRHGMRRRWVFEDFDPVVRDQALGRSSSPGTSLRVWPDPRVFRSRRANTAVLEQRLRGIRRVRPSLSLALDGAELDEPAGLETWLGAQHCAAGHEVRSLEARRGTTSLECAWVWLPPLGSARRLSYVNLRENEHDGAAIDGLLAGLAAAHGVSLAMARERTLALVNVIAVGPRFRGPEGRYHDPGLQRWIAELVEREQARSA